MVVHSIELLIVICSIESDGHSIEAFFKYSTKFQHLGFAKPRFVMGNRAIALEDSLTPGPWYLGVNLGAEGVCIPSSQAGLRAFGRYHKEHIIDNFA